MFELFSHSKYIKKILFLQILLVFLSFSLHKYYVSVMEVHYIASKNKLEIIMRIFPDDILNLISDLNHYKANEFDDKTKKNIQKYLLRKIIFIADNQKVNYKILGMKTKGDFLVILIEANVHIENTLQVKNVVLQDYRDEQKNIIQFYFNDKKSSFISIKSDNTANFKL